MKCSFAKMSTKGTFEPDFGPMGRIFTAAFSIWNRERERVPDRRV